MRYRESSCSQKLNVLGADGLFGATGVEPTNNFAERIIRAAVLWRRTSFGTQSEAGSRFVERILTATATLKLQNRNVLSYLTNAIDNHRRGVSAPSLLPNQVLLNAQAT